MGVLADITGMTGQRIIEAIFTDERNPQRLAALRNPKWRGCQTARQTLRAFFGSAIVHFPYLILWGGEFPRFLLRHDSHEVEPGRRRPPTVAKE